jgi:hypothetical protein
MNNSKSNTGLAGEKWFEICKLCQEEVKECCRNLEITLFPDELEFFRAHDPKHVTTYKDGTFGYETKRCIFLLPSNECDLQKNGKPKPIDCIIYPLNFKNAKIFIDSSCWAKRLLNVEKAFSLVQQKLEKYPMYRNVQYEVRESDIFIQDIPVI